jgi:hypothetical protein
MDIFWFIKIPNPKHSQRQKSHSRHFFFFLFNIEIGLELFRPQQVKVLVDFLALVFRLAPENRQVVVVDHRRCVVVTRPWHLAAYQWVNPFVNKYLPFDLLCVEYAHVVQELVLVCTTPENYQKVRYHAHCVPVAGFWQLPLRRQLLPYQLVHLLQVYLPHVVQVFSSLSQNYCSET